MNYIADAATAVPAAPVAHAQRLAVIIRAAADGSALAVEPVHDADLAEAQAECWRELCLRKGRLVPLASLQFDLVPIAQEGAAAGCLAGFALAVASPAGLEGRTLFTARALKEVASRAAKKLLAAEKLKGGEKYYYEVITQAAAPAAAVAPTGPALFKLTIQSAPLPFLSVSLQPLLQRATPVNLAADAGEYPIFFTAAAFQKAELFSRRGAAHVPPVESGAALVGPLCVCPDSGEFFVVVTDALEAIAAEQTAVTLAYSARSWDRIQTVVRARQQVQPAVRLLGQSHGHNFLPNNGEKCAACDQRPTCPITSVFVSPEDRLWTRAVFARQPWQLCHIFGLTVRGEKAEGLFALHDGRLRQRGYYLVEDFDPASAGPTITTGPETI